MMTVKRKYVTVYADSTALSYCFSGVTVTGQASISSWGGDSTFSPTLIYNLQLGENAKLNGGSGFYCCILDGANISYLPDNEDINLAALAGKTLIVTAR